MPYPDWQPGMRITAERLLASQWQELVQGTEYAVTNTTTLANSGISVPVPAGSRWMYRLIVVYTADPAADLRLAWATTGGATVGRIGTWGIGDAATGVVNSVDRFHARSPAQGTQIFVGGLGVSDFVSYHEEGILTGASIDGTVTLQFAQRAAHASDVTLRSNTRIWYLRVG